jgi:outer membrane protein OmpA-like peptidoglycan-associated protein
MSDNNLALTPSGLRSFNRWHWILMLILAALLLLLPMFTSIGPNSYLKCGAPAATAVAPVAPVAAPVAPPVVVAPAPAPEPAPKPPAPALPAPPPAAKVYFASDKYVLPDTAAATLAPIVDYLKAHPSAKALISGFHDPRGDKAYNEELALNRARSVRTSLEKSGIDKARIDMAKPADSTGTGPNPEARRVEVSIAP